ncbi:MAG: hypothetical protein JWP45_1500 [Mucilaginibacter sp.]|nr:hypothetical protein [Mucilaginibacter sp.]
MQVKKQNKTGKVSSADDRAERIRKKAASATTNESGVAAELKNREHGSEKPAR